MEQIDNLASLVNASNLKIGNRVRGANGNPAAAAVTNISVDANSNLQATVPLTAAQPATNLTGELMSLTGSPNGNALTQTFVAGASVSTATAAGYFRIAMVSDNSAIFSTSAYYLPVYTLA